MPADTEPLPGRSPRTALYAISADPITNGHVDVVERVRQTFDRVVVGIGRNPVKRYLFSPEARLELARRALAHLSEVTVLPFQGMVVDFATEQGAQVIVKGVRNAADFDYEQLHHLVGLSQRAGIDTHVLFASPGLGHVSSSAVKAIQAEHGFVQDFAPPVVKAALEEVLCGQLLIGVTGVAGAGKSTLCRRLVEAGRRQGLPVHDVDLDRIAHAVLGEAASPLAARTRQELLARFGGEIAGEGGIDRRCLARLAFASPESLDALDRIMIPAVTVGLRRALYGLRGVVLVDGALLAEQGLLPVCNNRVILVEAGPALERRRLAARGWSAPEVEARVAAQWGVREKEQAIEEAILSGRFGRLWRWDGAAELEEEAATERAAGLLREILTATGARLESAAHAA